MNKDTSPSVGQPRVTGPRALAACTAVAALAALAACGDTRPVGTIGHVKGFGGLVAADEPRAAVVARDVLSAGGSAADAAVSLYFTLSATYPSTATLGGGGACVVWDKDKKTVEALDFVAPPSVETGENATAVPANPRGFFALHAKYGRLKWESLLAEPERLARAGVPVSRTLAYDLGRAQQLLARDPGMRRLFFRPDGTVLREGDQLQQPELAALISRLRRNTGDFYTGTQARELQAAAKAAGGTLTLDDLREFRPRWVETLKVKAGNETAHFAPPPAVGSTVAAQLVGALWDRHAAAAEDERPHLLAESSAQAFAARARWMLPHGWTEERPAALVSAKALDSLAASYSPSAHVATPGAVKPTDSQTATGFAVVDSSGSAVACGLTAYGLFGSGRVAPGTGIVLAGSPGRQGPPAIAPMLTVNHHTAEIHFAGDASGGVTAPTALATVFLAAAREGKSLDEALARTRIHHSGMPDVAFTEGGARTADSEPLQRRGHQTAAVEMPSRVVAVHCPTGRLELSTCQAASDPRGSGLGLVVGKD